MPVPCIIQAIMLKNQTDPLWSYNLGIKLDFTSVRKKSFLDSKHHQAINRYLSFSAAH